MDLTKYDIVFFTVSCTEPSTEVYSIFSRKERFQQLITTVESCNKFENSISVISEGSILSEKEINSLPKNTIVLRHENDVKSYLKNKQLGTLKLWEEGLKKIEVNDNCIIVFLAGRYVLNEYFIPVLNGDYSFKQEISWSNPSLKLVHTTCFKIRGNKKNEFIEIIKKTNEFIKKSGLDVEHAFWHFLQNEKIDLLKNIECYGLLGPSGINTAEIYNKSKQ